MPRMTRQQLQEIIARDMPGYELAPPAAPRPTPAADSVAPDINQLWSKLCPDRDPDPGDQMLQVGLPGGQIKAAVISGGRVIAQQG